jgi:hypothetical protein
MYVAATGIQQPAASSMDTKVSSNTETTAFNNWDAYISIKQQHVVACLYKSMASNSVDTTACSNMNTTACSNIDTKVDIGTKVQV